MTHILAGSLINKGENVAFLSFTRIKDSFDFIAPQFYFPKSNPDAPENRQFLIKFIKSNAIQVIVFQNTGFYSNRFPFDIFPIEGVKLINVVHNDPARGVEFFWRNRMRRTGTRSRYLAEYIPRLLLGLLRKRDFIKEMRSDFVYITANSDATVLLSTRFFPGVSRWFKTPVNTLRVIPNPLSYTIENCEQKKENIILFVGRLTGNKQCDEVIRVWNMLAPKYPEWKLYILGDGPMRSFLETIVMYPEQTVFKGITPPEEYYRRAKIYCMASCYEGWGMVVTEAMSKGAVPIAYDSYAAIRDIITNRENGILVEAFNRQKYKEKLERLMTDENNRKRMALNAIRSVKSYSPEIIADKWIELFKHL